MLANTYLLCDKIKENYGPFAKILDVGSMQVSGGCLRGYFGNDCEYVGLDMRKGDNVTCILNAHDIDTKFSEGYFDLVVCFDTLEHDDKFWLTVEQMKKALKVGGILAIGVPGIRCPLHEHPGDYYRFMDSGVKVMFEGCELLSFENLDRDGELQAVGRKL
jgi:SAM-dependent methyltransferase